jgi:serine protease Do
MKRAWLVVAILAAAAPLTRAEPDAAVVEAEAQRIAAIHRVRDCVLAVFPPGGQGGGSGVVITRDGYALSNFHVVLPCGRALQCGMADGRVYDAVLVSIDPTGDVALIKLFGRDDFPSAELGDSDRVRPGDWVFAMGNPFLLATDMQPTVTYGIVSGVHRYQFPAGTLLEYADCLQIDASINPGNSGGPLFDAQGQLIGINGRASFEKRGRVNVGAAYAISINQIKNFLGALRGGRIVDHATLGARVGTDADGRVVVTEILERSDAYRRGLRYDDEIVSFGGRPIATPNGFKNVLGIFPSGWRVPLGYRHDGKRYDTLVRLAGVHGQEELIEKAHGQQPAEPMPIPNPDEGPKSKPRDAENPKGGPHQLPPHGRRAKPAPAGHELPVPAVVQQHFVEKRGYANYYFNALNQQRVWKAWIARANPDVANGAWTLSGQRLSENLPSPVRRAAGSESDVPKVAPTLSKAERGRLASTSPATSQSKEGDKFQFHLTDGGASLKLFTAEIKWTAGDELGSSLLPAHSGGLLPALYLWRKLAVEGLGRFGDVYYYGTAPLRGHEQLADVLIGSHKGVECRFYFDPADGRLLAMEMSSDEDSDPCEVYFSDYHETAGPSWPGQIEVRHGDEAFALFKVKEARVEK